MSRWCAVLLVLFWVAAMNAANVTVGGGHGRFRGEMNLKPYWETDFWWLNSTNVTRAAGCCKDTVAQSVVFSVRADELNVTLLAASKKCGGADTTVVMRYSNFQSTSKPDCYQASLWVQFADRTVFQPKAYFLYNKNGSFVVDPVNSSESATCSYTVKSACKTDSAGTKPTSLIFAGRVGDSSPVLAVAELIAGLCVIVSLWISIYAIILHVIDFRDKVLQSYCVRILGMVPVYVVLSYLTLYFHEYLLYFYLLRGCYEAYSLYCFYMMMTAFVAPDRAGVIAVIDQLPLHKHSFPLNCAKFKFKPNAKWLHRCRQGIMQLVILKPIMALLSAVLEIFHVLHEGEFGLRSPYMYIVIVENLSITVALYFLIEFSETLWTPLKPYHPLPKLICIKAVVAFAFWQSIILAVLNSFGVIKDGEDWTADDVFAATGDFLICLEMVPLSVYFAYAFGASTYRDQSRRHPVLLEATDYLSVRNADIMDFYAKRQKILKNLITASVPTDLVREAAVAAGSAPRFVQVGEFFQLSLQEQQTRVVHSGWLEKQGSDTLKTYRTRWFVLINDPPSLIYFKKDPYYGGETNLLLEMIPGAQLGSNVLKTGHDLVRTTGSILKGFSLEENPPLGFVSLDDVTEVRNPTKRIIELHTAIRKWRLRAPATEEQAWFQLIFDLHAQMIKSRRDAQLSAEQVAAAAAAAQDSPVDSLPQSRSAHESAEAVDPADVAAAGASSSTGPVAPMAPAAGLAGFDMDDDAALLPALVDPFADGRLRTGDYV